MLSSWIISRDRLDPDQIRILDAPVNSNIWISGFAGSGKSILLVHKAIDIKDKNPNSDVVIAVYTLSLVDLFKSGLSFLNHSDIEVITIYDFIKRKRTYDYTLCDEIQDFTKEMVQALRNYTRNKIIVAGDKFQSIYETDARGNLTIDPPTYLPQALSVNNYELTKIYRLTPSIIKAIDCFLPSMGLATNGKPNAQKVNVSIKLGKCINRRDEAIYVYNHAERYIHNNEGTAILLPQHIHCIEFFNYILKSKGKPEWEIELNRWGRPDFGLLNSHLSKNGIKLMYIGNGYGSLRDADRTNLGVVMTYQSSKGLDFENVYLPFLNNDMFITYNDSRSKTIFMVAMSRSNKNLTLTHSGLLFPYVTTFRHLCSTVNPNDTPTNNTGDDFDF